jgi:hypothetical protein
LPIGLSTIVPIQRRADAHAVRARSLRVAQAAARGVAFGDVVDRLLRIDVRLFLGALHSLREFHIGKYSSRAEAGIALQRRAYHFGAGPHSLQVGIAPGRLRWRPWFRRRRLAGAQGGQKKQ